MSANDPDDSEWLKDAWVPHPRPPVYGIQGLLLDRILVGKWALDDSDPYTLIDANIEFANWAMQTARLVPGEFPQESMWSYYVDYYCAQVNNGGHAQFVANSRMTLLTVGCCQRGLRAMGALEHAEIFDDLVRIVAENEDLHHEDLSPLDDRYYPTGPEELIAKNSAWLRSLPCLQGVDDDELPGLLDRAKDRNLLFAARAEEAQRERLARQEGGARHRVVKSLCEAAGVEFIKFVQAVWSPMKLAPKRFELCWTVLTSEGLQCVFFIFDERDRSPEGPRAELRPLGEPRPSATSPLSWEDYDEIISTSG